LRAQSATFGTSTSGHPRPEDPIESSADAGPGEASCRDLLESLRTVVDPRKRRGIPGSQASSSTAAADALFVWIIRGKYHVCGAALTIQVPDLRIAYDGCHARR